MGYVWGPTDALWAARLGELCGRTDAGPAAEWTFLDGWLELLGAKRGCLVVVRPDEAPSLFCRGYTRQVRPVAADLLRGSAQAVSVVDGRGTDGEPALRVLATGEAGHMAVLTTIGGASKVSLITSMYPCIERALVRLAERRTAPVETTATARGAWERAAVPMLILQEDLSIFAANPACALQLDIEADDPLPNWLKSRIQATLGGVKTGGEAADAWTTAEAGGVYRLSIVAVDPGEGLPGRWLVTAVKGGPDPKERTMLAEVEFGLTRRETDIVELLAEGLSNRQLAGAFGVTEATVKAHLVNIMRKAEAPSRTELLARLYTLHIVDPEVEVPYLAQRMSTGYLWQTEDRIVHCVQDAGTAMELDGIHEFTEGVRSFYDGVTPLLVYSDASGIRSTTGEAQKEGAKPLPFVGAVAIRGGSAVSRALVNLYLKVFKPQYPTRLFSDRASALEWLHSLECD